MSTSAAALSLVTAIACGSATPPLGDAGENKAPDLHALRYECGQGPFDASKLEGPGDLEHSETALGEALRDLLTTPDGAIGGDGWRIVHEDDNEVLVAAPSTGRGHPYASALFERSGDGWRPVGWGDCSPTAVLDERSPALWKLGSEPRDDATEVQLLVTERACSSGRKLTEDNTRADIEYSNDEIVILMSADPLSGDQNCIGNPPASITVVLDEPVGGRRLVDAGIYPPAPRDA